MRLIPRFINPRDLIITEAMVIIRSLGLINRGINWNPVINCFIIWVNLKLVIFFLYCNSHHKAKKICVSQGNTWASLLSTCDFLRKMNRIQNKQNVAKRKTTWGRHKTRRCITSCCWENADWIAKPLFKYRPIREYIFKISSLDFPCYYFWVHATVFKSNVNLACTFERWSSHFEMESEVVFCPIRI
jgi:hypothetical protein